MPAGEIRIFATDSESAAQDSLQKASKSHPGKSNLGTRFGEVFLARVKTSVLAALRGLVGSCLYCCEVCFRSIRHWIEGLVVLAVPVEVEEPLLPVPAQVPAPDPQVPPAVPDQAVLRARRRLLIRTGPVYEPRTSSSNRTPTIRQ